MIPSVVALAAGLVLPFAFAPTEWWPLAPLSIAVLYVLLLRIPAGADAAPGARRAAWLGWVFGVGYFGIGVNWVYHSLHLFGGAASVFAIFLTVIFVLVMTAFPAVTGWLWWRLRSPERPLLSATLFAALWTLSELARAKIMGGFPWISLGYSQTSAPLGELAPIMGVYGIGFVLVASTLALIVLVRGPRLSSRIAASIVLAVTGLAPWGGSTLEFSTPKDSPLGVRLVQANIAQEMKFSRERLRRSIDDYLELTVQDLGDDIDLVIWPETAIPAGFDQVEPAIAPSVATLDARGIDVLSGGFDRTMDGVFNAVRQLGGEQQMYRKRHIVPFGEYLPLRSVLEVFEAFIVIPGSDLSRGEGAYAPPLDLQGEKIGLSICYEDVFGEEMRALLPEATLLVNVSNDAWFGTSAAPHQHEQKARMRARELARPLIRVTNTGVSSSIAYDGRVEGRIAQFTRGVLDVQVLPRTGLTWYARTGNWVVFGLALTVCGVAGLNRQHRSRPVVRAGERLDRISFARAPALDNPPPD